MTTSLPSELVDLMLTNLPFHSLLAFSATSQTSCAQAYRLLQHLNLAVLPRDIHCQLALMLQTNYQLDRQDCSQINIAKASECPGLKSRKEQNPALVLDQHVLAQNRIAADLIEKQALRNLKSLSLSMYDIRSTELTTAMAQNLSKLQHLDLNFCHPYIHGSPLPSSYWQKAPQGSSCWNALVGLGSDNQQALRMRGLRSLKIQRAGLTSTQLRRFIEANPRLRELHLNNVTGVDREFVAWLGRYCASETTCLSSIELENCPRLIMQQLEHFTWLKDLNKHRVDLLSLWMCKNVTHDLLASLVESDVDYQHLRQLELVLPQGPVNGRHTAERARQYAFAESKEEGWKQSFEDRGDKIDVDPAYMVAQVAVAA